MAGDPATYTITCTVTYNPTKPGGYTFSCSPNPLQIASGSGADVRIVFQIVQPSSPGVQGWTFQPYALSTAAAEYYYGITIFNDSGVAQFEDESISADGTTVTLTDLNSTTSTYTYGVVVQNLALKRLLMIDPTIKNSGN